MANVSIIPFTDGIGINQTTKTKLVKMSGDIEIGQVVFYNSTTKLYEAANNLTEETAKVAGMALTRTPDGAYGLIATSGPVDFGTGLVRGTIYVLSSTGGAICPSADLNGTDWVTIIGVAQDGGVIILDIRINPISIS